MDIDYSTCTDEELSEHQLGLSNEVHKRQQLQSIPNQVRTLKDQYSNSGGEVSDLVAVINEPAPEPSGPSPASTQSDSVGFTGTHDLP